MQVPMKILDQHLFGGGKTGAGKSFMMAYLVAKLIDEKRRVCVVTAKGDWWGLRLSADGKRPGYPVVIFGGPNHDVPLSPRSGREIGEIVATGTRPVVIQLRGWMPADMQRFWIDFASTIFNKNNSPLWLVIDEVHNFAPQGKVLDVNAGKMLHWTNRLASEGRGIGVRLVMASQRPQKVHKDTLTSAETLVAMRVIHNLDRGAIKDWVDGHGDPERSRTVLNTLAEMQRGEAWVWSPEIKYFERVRFPIIETFDSFNPENAGRDATKMKGWKPVDVNDINKQLADVLREIEARDPDLLTQRILRLQAELAAKTHAEPDAKAIEELEHRMRREYDKRLSAISSASSSIAQALGEAIAHVEYLDQNLTLASKVMVPPAPIPMQPQPKAFAQFKPFTGGDADVDHPFSIKLRAGARRMLSALVQWYPNGMTPGQMRTHAGMKKSGTYDAYMRDLTNGGFIKDNGEFLFATQKGIIYIGDAATAAPNTTAGVVDLWSSRLRAGARRMLQTLVAHKEPMTIMELQGRSGVGKGGTFDAYLRDLRTAGLLADTDRGMVGANKEALFL